jgi:hypothetical protein
VPKNRLIAIGDVLGFKETILQSSLEVVVDQYFVFFRRALQHALRQQGWPSVPDDFEELRRSAPIGIEWFSDTIVLFAREDTDSASQAVLDAAAWLLFETMFVTPVRLRFGMDYGELHADSNAGQIVGRSVVGAHLLEADQKWAGGALTPAAAERVGGVARNDTLVEYSIPFKKGSCATSVAINWTYGDHQPLRIRWSPSSDEPKPEDHRDRADVVEKWQNTNIFHEKVCFWCRQRR